MIKSDVLQETEQLIRIKYQREGLRAGILRKVGITQGWNVVIGTAGQCGMAINFTGWESAFGPTELNMEQVREFVDSSLFELAQTFIRAESWQERSIGVAALCALSQPLLASGLNSSRTFEALSANHDLASQLKEDDIVAVVGYGGGVKRLLGKAAELHVTDMRPTESLQTLIIGDSIEISPSSVHFHPHTDNEKVLNRATVVAITGSALVNNTFEELMSYARGARLITIYGHSASLYPDALFQRGIDLIHTTQIIDPKALELGMHTERNMESVVKQTQSNVTLKPVRGDTGNE